MALSLDVLRGKLVLARYRRRLIGQRVRWIVRIQNSFAASYAKESVVVELVGALGLGTMGLLTRGRR